MLEKVLKAVKGRRRRRQYPHKSQVWEAICLHNKISLAKVALRRVKQILNLRNHYHRIHVHQRRFQ
jgi:hypothetical protein